MNVIDCGISGAITEVPTSTRWDDLPINQIWRDTLAALHPGPTPRPVQVLALDRYRLLETRRNLIVSAPTNSGKSLVGLLTLLQAIHQGRRAVLLVPLRAIARERADELTTVLPQLCASLRRSFTIRVTTGDYRQEDEVFSAPPPGDGELIIATPERLEAILRRPDCDDWLVSVGAVCVDEAHLIASKERGPTLEYLLTSLLCLPTPPRLTLLSATFGDLERIATWLSPCDVIHAPQRWPSLYKEVVALEPGDDANTVVLDLAKQILREPDTSVLIFVYQTRSAERLATLLGEAIDTRRAPDSDDAPAAYHSQMSMHRRERIRASFAAGRCRCVVTTTALGLGVNLPATHVIIRDTIFAGAGNLSVADVLQMAGRAGRGDRAGRAMVIARPTDTRPADELARLLRDEEVATLTSHFDGVTSFASRPIVPSDAYIAATAATQVAAQLSRRAETGASYDELVAFFSRSLGGATLAAHVTDALAWLMDPARVLAHQDDQTNYHLTVLGLKATRSVLPLATAAGFGQLVRDLLSLDPSDRLLERWRPMDHLIVLELLAERSFRGLRPFSTALVDQVDTWMEVVPDQVSLLYREWIAGQPGASRASEVLGSLGLRPAGRTGARNGASKGARTGDHDEWARKEAYLAAFRALVLYQRAQGTSLDDLERRWGVKGLEGIEERWRDERLWLLSGLVRILDLRSFYFHLCEACGAEPDRVRRVKRLLRRMRMHAFELQEQLKYCSPLGPLVQSVRRTRTNVGGASIGVESIRRLETAGVRNLGDLTRLRIEDLVQIGVRRDLAQQLEAYIRRRLQ